jgi:pimeloyl-ACP methyl ester carboxylesterase
MVRSTQVAHLRFSVALILVASILAAAVAPGHSSYAAPSSPHKVIVFVAGLGSSLAATSGSASCSGGGYWQAVETALASDRFACSDVLLYSYTGGTVDESGTWHPSPYSCFDTGNHVAASAGKLVSLMTSYRAAHLEAQFVLIGHSLGGLVALQASAQMPTGSIADVVTIDSPLKGASRRNLRQFIRLVQPFIAFAGCSKVLWDSDAERDIATIHNSATRKQASNAADALVRAGRGKGFRYMTVGNASDCLWKPAACSIRGRWSDDSRTMTARSADTGKLYPLGNGGCNLSNVINKKGQVQIRNVPEIICVATSHGLAIQAGSPVIPDIVRFVGPGSS